MNKKNNLRFRNTRKVLEESLVDLLETKPLDKISVSDVCSKADVNRSTFYAHFRTVPDMLSSMRNRFVAERPVFHEKTAVSKLDKMIAYLEYVQKNGKQFHMLLHLDSLFQDELIYQGIMKFIQDNQIVSIREDTADPEKQAILTYASAGAAFVIDQWIISGYIASAEDVAHWLLTFTNQMSR